MSNVYIVVEGKGEQVFVERTLAVHLSSHQVWVRAVLRGKPGHKGGVRSWQAVRNELCNFLRMNRSNRPLYITIMFDYFRMPMDWPGRSDAPKLNILNRGKHVEEKIAADIATAMGEGFIQSRFIPYVQMHELEALIFASPTALKREFPDRAKDVDNLIADVGQTPPEEINDSPATAPGKRISKRIPEYEGRKSSAAPNVLDIIGLPTMRKACPRFEAWISRLEDLGV